MLNEIYHYYLFYSIYFKVISILTGRILAWKHGSNTQNIQHTATKT